MSTNLLNIVIDLGELLKRKIGFSAHGKEIGLVGIGDTSHGVEGVSQSSTGGYGVYGVNSTGGTGVAGESNNADGVFGRSGGTNGAGVHGRSEAGDAGFGVLGEATATGAAGISQNWVGVYGESNSVGKGAAGVWADGKDGAFGVKGHARGDGTAGVAGFQLTNKGDGVYGEGATGVHGVGQTGSGVWGLGQTASGVYGETHGAGTDGAAGVLGEGLESGLGVKGISRAERMAGVAGYNVAGNGPGVYGEGVPAGYFHGDVIVTGDLRLAGADVAEQFEVGTDVQDGTVVVLEDDGSLRPSATAYDKRVAGVVSGAGDRKPALVLDRVEALADRPDRKPVAVVGKAWCRSVGPIGVGDLLTTAAEPGHAMVASDRDAAFGAVIGKALTPLAEGRGMVLVLVGLG